MTYHPLPIVALILLLTSCSENNQTTTPESDSDVTTPTDAGIDNGAPWELFYHGTDNFVTLDPDSIETRRFHYTFDTDALAELIVFDAPLGITSISSEDGTISLASFSSPAGFSTTQVQAGSWDLIYEPVNFNENQSPFVFIRFSESPYFLDIETSTQQVQADGRAIRLEAYISKSPTFNDNGTITFGQVLVPQSMDLSVNYTLPDGSKKVLPLNDDGVRAYGDATAGDGRYSAIILLAESGDYEFVIEANGQVEDNPVHRELVVHDSLSEFRAQLASSTAQATPDQVFEQGLSEGQYAVPILLNFVSPTVPDFVSILAEIWATDNVGEQIRIVDHITGIIHPEPLADEIHGLALIVQPMDVPNVGRFASVVLRITALSSTDTGDNILIGNREITLTGLPD